VADHRGRRVTGGSAAPDGVANQRVHPEHVEELRRDQRHVAVVCRAADVHARLAAGVGGHRSERCGGVVPVVIVGARHGAAATGLLPLVGERDDAVGVGIIERTQQHGVDGAENRGVRADPERQRANRQQRERGLTAQRAGGIAKIL